MNDKRPPATREEQENECLVRLNKINSWLDAKMERFVAIAESDGKHTVKEIETERGISQAGDASILKEFEYVQNNLVGSYPETETEKMVRKSLAKNKIAFEELAVMSKEIFDDMLDRTNDE